MRFFIYCLACILGFSNITYSSDKNNSLPPLPTFEMPGSKDATVRAEPPSVDIKPSSDIPENNTPSPPTVPPESDSSNKATTPNNPTEESDFIDTGNFTLPKITKSNSSPSDNPPVLPDIVLDAGGGAVTPEVNVTTAGEEKQTDNITTAPDPTQAPVQEVEPTHTISDATIKPNDQAASVTPITSEPVSNSPMQPLQPSEDTLQPIQTRGALQPTEARSKRGRGRNEVANESPEDDRLSFVNDESVMLLLEDDDIVLGNLTKKAYLENMHGKDYINLFNKTYVSKLDEKKAYKMDAFIGKYEFADSDNSVLPYKEAKKLAFEAVKRDNIDDLRVLIENYQILQSHDKNGNNMLMLAIELGNVPLSKFLLIRGTDLFDLNKDGENIISISRESGDPIIQRIVSDAIFIGKVK